MKNETGQFEGFEGAKMFYQKWLPDSGDIKAYLIAIHGWATHSDRMAIPAKYFTQKGFAVYSFDTRGHWRNAAELSGHIVSMNHIQKDIEIFFDMVKKDAGGKKVLLMGHSFGGLISLKYAIDHPDLLGVLVSSPLLGIALKLSFSLKVKKALSSLIVKLSPEMIVPIELDANDFTTDQDILKINLEDPEVLAQITVKTYVELNKTMKYALANASNLKVPCLIMQAGDDKAVDAEKTKEFYDKVQIEDKKFILYDGFLHELWNEKDRQRVFKDMEEWLNKLI